MDRLAGRRVAAVARRALGDAELAEASDRDVAASAELDRVEDDVDSAVGLLAGQAGRGANLLGELLLGIRCSCVLAAMGRAR
jgi:hypothetical protein